MKKPNRAPDPELDQMLDGIVTTEDCMRCKACCTFHDDDKVDAPLFTNDQREEVEASDYGQRVTFSPKNNMWQVDLVDRGNGSYVCPLLDKETHRCNARAVNNFDCRTWPFYVMKQKTGETNLTLSPDCPAAAPRLNDPEVQERIAGRVLPFMVERVAGNPDLIAEHRPEVIIIAPVQIPRRDQMM